MWGPDDPSNRQPMVWRDLGTYENSEVKFDPEVFKTYQRGIAARATLPALRGGFFRTIVAEDKTGIYGFERELGEERVYVVVNRSGEKRTVKVPVQEKGPVVDWLNANEVDLRSESPEDRLKLSLRKSAHGLAVRDGACEMTMEPWETAILTKK